MANLNFKALNVENWLKQDSVMQHFGGINISTGKAGVRPANDWAALFLQPKLHHTVPDQVAGLVEAARGATLYGWFFYPLYVIAEGQMYIAAEAALREKYLAVTGVPARYERLPRFAKLLGWAVKEGVVTEDRVAWWRGAERRRNATTHAPIQGLKPPIHVLETLVLVCQHINALFE